jgi:hypothetical protein
VQHTQSDASGSAELVVTWTEAIDLQSGVVEYLVGVGRGAGATDVVGLVNVGLDQHAAIELPADVRDGTPVVITVKAAGDLSW